MSASTKERLLDAAEPLFAAHGFHGTSTRAIAAAAGANSAAPNFHFESKQGLYLAVLQRRMRPLAQRRLAALDAIEAQGRTASLEELIDIVVDPVVEAIASGDPGQAAFFKIFARSTVTADPILMALLADELDTYATRLRTAFATALPHLSHDDVVVRLVFLMGALAHAFVDETRRAMMQASPAANDPHFTAAQLRRFLLAGMAA